MAFSTRQYLMGTASGIMKTSDKWQSIIGGACFPLSGNALGLINHKERVPWKSIYQGNSQLSWDVRCSARVAPLSGEKREDQELQQHLADSMFAGHREVTGRVFCMVARVWPRASRLQGKEGWWPGRGAAAGTPCCGVQEWELPFLPALLIKELLFLAV